MLALLAALAPELRSDVQSHGGEQDDVGMPKRMQEAGALLQTLLDQLPEGVTIAYGPPDFPIIASSRGLEELMGFPRRDLLGISGGGDTDDHGLFASDGATRPEAGRIPLYRASRFGETVRNEELVVKRRDGTRADILVDAQPITTPDGRVVGAISCWRDISEMKQAQRASRALEAQLQDADMRKNEFLAMLAHELKGPLAPIRNASDLLKRMTYGEPRLRMISDMLDRQVEVMARLLDDLLDLSRVTRGTLSLRRELVEMSAVIGQAVEWNRADVEAKRQQLTVTCPRSGVAIDGDPVRLAQMVSNLVGNAVKFTDAGGRIWIAAESDAGEVTVRVRDTGPGLDASELGNIFELFYQVDRTADRTGRGLGIGLSLVRRLVELHGGRVAVRSDGPGCGSEFVLVLPAGAADGARQPGVARAAKARDTARDHAKEAACPAGRTSPPGSPGASIGDAIPVS